MSDIDNAYNDLVLHLDELKSTFLAEYLADPLANPVDYELQLRAYCVLTHAAFEEYFENIAVIVLTDSITQWTTTGKVRDSLITIAIHYFSRDEAQGRKPSRGASDDAKVREVSNLLTAVFSNADTWFKIDAVQGNHGAGLKYLKKLLEPVGIDISNDPIQLAALAFLVSQRGDVAHKYSKRLTSSVSPQSLLVAVKDCLNLCDEIRINANNKLI